MTDPAEDRKHQHQSRDDSSRGDSNRDDSNRDDVHRDDVHREGLAGTVGPEDPEVTRSMRLLDGLEALPVSEHPERFHALHAALQDRLAAIERD